MSQEAGGGEGEPGQSGSVHQGETIISQVRKSVPKPCQVNPSAILKPARQVAAF